MKKVENNIICNCCGKKITIQNEIPSEEFLHINKAWGYFSKKDGKRQEMDICETCFDAWAKQFQVPVQTTEMTEFV
ncbi:hypothetical protein LQZ18_03430 [Lachnospiraceae bacterium ZAX-1]